ncbi:MAG: aldo/keto reductase, partial [Pseudomonadota bacterium]
ERFSFLRGGENRLNRKNIEAAIDGSLKRLGVDAIDLYQLHWPDRATNFFGALGYVHTPDDPDVTPLAESLGALQDFVAAGKIRAVGLSNETPWGVGECLRLADRLGLPRVVTIQNPYNLLNRTFEVGLSEIAIREDVGLLAYSPLAFGTLSGKYLGGVIPAGSRLEQHPTFRRYMKPNAVAATERYVAIAREAGLDPAQMALAYVNSRPFVTSNLIGATSPEQLAANIASAQLTLSEDVVAAIEAVHAELPNPAP